MPRKEQIPNQYDVSIKGASDHQKNCRPLRVKYPKNVTTNPKVYKSERLKVRLK